MFLSSLFVSWKCGMDARKANTERDMMSLNGFVG